MQSSSWGQARQATWQELCLEGEAESAGEGQGERAKVRGRLGQGQQWLVRFSEESPQAGLCPLWLPQGILNLPSPLSQQPGTQVQI